MNSANAKGLRTIVGMQHSVVPAARYSVKSGNRRVPNGTHGGVGGRRAD